MNEIRLAGGAHKAREQGMCAMEFVAWVANEEHGDSPKCVDHQLATFFICLNDDLPDDERQMLKPYLGRCIGTQDDGMENHRQSIWQALGAGLPSIAGMELAKQPAAQRRTWLDRLLPTEELPEVTEAIRQKVATVA